LLPKRQWRVKARRPGCPAENLGNVLFTDVVVGVRMYCSNLRTTTMAESGMRLRAALRAGQLWLPWQLSESRWSTACAPASSGVRMSRIFLVDIDTAHRCRGAPGPAGSFHARRQLSGSGGVQLVGERQIRLLGWCRRRRPRSPPAPTCQVHWIIGLGIQSACSVLRRGSRRRCR
jgi:hypothetical protein